MPECFEYEKYFFDFTDNILTEKTDKSYKKHLKKCSFCSAEFKTHEQYQGIIQAKQQEKSPDEFSLRLQHRFKSLQQEEKKNSLLEEFGLVSINEMVKMFHLTQNEKTLLENSEKTVRLNKDLYLEKKHIIEVMKNIKETLEFTDLDWQNILNDFPGLELAIAGVLNKTKYLPLNRNN